MRLLRLAAPFIPFLFAGAMTTADADAFRRAEALVRANKLADAAAVLDRAWDATRDPGAAAFRYAGVRYLLARAGDARSLGEAEIAYRSCLQENDPYRPASLLGLGNCLLLRAASGGTDTLALRQAIDRFDECLRCDDLADDIRGAARYNLRRARLLLAQTPPRPDDAPRDDPPGQGDEKTDDPPEPKDKKDAKTPKDGKGPKELVPADKTPDKGAKEIGEKDTPGKEGKNAPGKGAVAPVPDDPAAPPVARDDAAAHLDAAAEKIKDEVRRRRLSRVKSPAVGQRDW